MLITIPAEALLLTSAVDVIYEFSIVPLFSIAKPAAFLAVILPPVSIATCSIVPLLMPATTDAFSTPFSPIIATANLKFLTVPLFTANKAE